MSKGSPILALRVPPLILASIRAAVEAAREEDPKRDWNTSKWMLNAAMMQAEIESERRKVNTPPPKPKARVYNRRKKK
jgi:hypothetical protein